MARALKSAVVLDCERNDAEKRSPLRPLRIQFGSKQVEISMLGNGAGRRWTKRQQVASVPASLKLVFIFDFDVSHYHSQLPFMYIDSRDPIRHRLPPARSGERAEDYTKQGLGLSPLPQGDRHRTIYSLYHARSGSDSHTALPSPLLNRSRRPEPSWIIARL